MERMTKAQILEGKRAAEMVEIEKLGCTVEIRPLTDGEWARVEAVQLRGVKTTIRGDDEVTMDTGKVNDNEHAADLLCCKIGLTEAWADHELEFLPAGAVAEISKAVQGLSGVGSGDPAKQEAIARVARSFRDESGGAGDSALASDGLSSGA